MVRYTVYKSVCLREFLSKKILSINVCESDVTLVGNSTVPSRPNEVRSDSNAGAFEEEFKKFTFKSPHNIIFVDIL